MDKDTKINLNSLEELGNAIPTVTRVTVLPPCDFCNILEGPIKPATYDGKTTSGPWAMMCEYHFRIHGIGLGLGRGQKLEVM